MTDFKIEVKDVICPICGSNYTRSKVCDQDGTWWYICDKRQEFDHGLIILPNGTEIDLQAERFYFNEEGTLDIREHEYQVERQEQR